MYNFLRKIFLILTLPALLVSCGQEVKQEEQREEKPIIKQQAENTDFKVNIRYAEGFRVEYFKDHVLLRVLNPWDRENDLGDYILVSKGDAEGVELEEGQQLIEVPVSRVAIMSLSNIGYFEELGDMDKIIAVSDYNRMYNKELRKKIELGSVKVLGNTSGISLEELLLTDCDIFIQTAYKAYSAEDEKIINAGVNLVYNIDWMEKTPLARAEWVKFIGLLCGQNKKADSVFREIEKNYIALKDLAAKVDYKPDVLVGGLYKDIWYMPGGQSFKARLLADAGTSYHWAADSSEGSLALNLETVVAEQLNAPVWIDVPFKTKKELLASNAHYAEFDAFKVGSMYHNLKRSNATGGNDYWETGMCRPDELLADLIRIFHFEELPDGELKYYQRVE